MAKHTKQTGFTIVELLIVIVIIGILATIVIVAYNGVQNRARASTVSADLSAASKKLAIYQIDNSGYPTDLATAGVTASPGTAYQYAYSNGSPQTFCITGTNGNVSYKVSESSSPQSGGCAGHGVGGVAAITNMIPNPSLETGVVGYSGSTSTATQSSAWASHGTNSLAITPTSATLTDSYSAIGGDSGGGFRLGMQAGQTYTLSAKQHIPVTLTGTMYTARVARITAWQYNGAYSFQSAGGTTTAGDYSLSVTFTIAPDATGAFIRLYNGTLAGGGIVHYDSIMLTSGSSSYNYADGSSTNWIWNGTANNSTSTGPAL